MSSRYPIAYRRAVSLSAFTTIFAVLVATWILGVVGAVLAVPLAAIVKLVTAEALRPRREWMAALRATLPAPDRRDVDGLGGRAACRRPSANEHSEPPSVRSPEG